MDEIYLGIDYGQARIGLARSYANLAEPLVTLPHTRHVMDEIARICHHHQVTAIVVGISENNMAQQSQQFGHDLQAKLGLPVYFMDETLSSQESKTRLHAGRQGKKQYTGPIDHYAAAIFLQNYLDDLA